MSNRLYRGALFRVLLAAALLLPAVIPSAAQAETSEPGAPQAIAGCEPYGPWPGAQYDPNRLMSMLGQPRDPNVGPFLSAHRGAWGTHPELPAKAPENSLIAINNAASLKFEMIELDVKMTASGELALMHDYTYGRTTTYGADSGAAGNWNPFLAETPDKDKPQDSGNWSKLAQYNPLAIKLLPSDTGTNLRLFDKTAGILGVMNGAEAKGSWDESGEYGKVPSLYGALWTVGMRYPGMTVVLDLRHLDEVKAAIALIDGMTDCQGTKASEWVILKPFANVFKGGWFNAIDPSSATPHAESVAAHIPNYKNYNWIPVVSNRLVRSNLPGQPSVIPGSPGPDVSQLTVDAKTYLQDWKRGLGQGVVTFEIGYGSSSPEEMKIAYDWAKPYITNMQSWRPPDIDVTAPKYDETAKKTIIGFNWKDDGIGAYPVYKETSRSYQDTARTAGAITIEDPIYVLKTEALSRTATQMAIVKQIPDFSRFYQYRIINKSSGKALNVAGGGTADGTNVDIWTDHTGESQMWRISASGVNTFRITNAHSGQALEAAANFTTDGTNVQIGTPDGTVAQEWSFARNADGTYSIVHHLSGRVLDAEGGSGADGTNVALWSSNGGSHQKWSIVPVKTFSLYNLNALKHLHTSGGNVDIRAGENSGYKWRLAGGRDGAAVLMNPAYGKALDVENAATTNGANVQVWNRNDGANQQWQLVYHPESDSYSVLNPNSEKVLDVYGSQTTDGSNVIIYADHGGANQRWKLFELEH